MLRSCTLTLPTPAPPPACGGAAVGLTERPGQHVDLSRRAARPATPPPGRRSSGTCPWPLTVLRDWLRKLLAAALRSTRVRCGRPVGEHLAGRLARADPAGAAPAAATTNSVRPSDPAEHAGEAAAVDLDDLEHLAALGDADAAAVGHVGVPDGTLGIDADPVGGGVAQVRPDPPVRQRAVGADLEARSGSARRTPRRPACCRRR